MLGKKAGYGEWVGVPLSPRKSDCLAGNTQDELLGQGWAGPPLDREGPHKPTSWTV